MGSDPSLDFGVGYVGKLLVSHWQTWGGGWSRSQGSFQVGGEGRGEAAGRRGAAVGGGGRGRRSRQRRGRAGETSGGVVSGVVNRGRFTPKSRREA